MVHYDAPSRRRHAEDLIRGWLLYRALLGALGDGKPIGLAVINYALHSDELESDFDDAVERSFNGNEAAAWESLECYAAGQSRLFMVTAADSAAPYWRGYAMVVEAASGAAAVVKVGLGLPAGVPLTAAQLVLDKPLAWW